ncbi:hypothetical protein BN946_scf184703.g4 [Trametes cinnabarina]|uniref:DUF659 domain-containing protein n=1 Tax=Pycnoporus cinnabarinus TaxID=5643 RepID=A0A060SS71_PYCCI|nr:hypothetical protein BN946_scf184703.g4 [Trametes cinnabarina]
MANTLSVTKRLQNLRFLLENLPDILPEPAVSQSPFQHLIGYSADPADVEEIGSISGAVNRSLEIVFGWEARSKGLLPITERGPAVCGLVDALEVYRKACQKPESDAILLKWLEDIGAGIRQAYSLAGKEFPPSGQPFPELAKETGRKRKASTPLEAVIISDDENDNPAAPGQAAPTAGVKLCDLIDIPWPSGEAVASGRPVKEETRAFAVKCRHKESNKKYWRCLAPRCTFFRAGPPQPKRILKHAMVCRAFPVDERRKANEFAAAYSLGAKLGEVQEEDVRAASSNKGGTTERSAGSPAGGVAVVSHAGSQPKQKTLGGAVLAVGREELKAKLDFHIVKLICVRGLIPNVIDSREWKDFVHTANPRYKPTSSSTFADVHIPAEAAKIRILQIEYLRNQTHLTLTYDGATTQKPQSVYTIHVTTQDRRVFFMDGAETSRDSHTAEKVKSILLEVMEVIGIERFSGICSDSAGNTRKARELLAKEISGLLNLPDCCHHLQNTAKDITKLPDFKDFIRNLRKIIQYFRRSTKASNDLTAARLEEGLTRGLQSIGKTRFASVYWSAESLRACLPLMRHLVSNGKLVIPRKGSYQQAKFDVALLQENNMASMKFEQQLTRYTTILAPIARAIKSLEATDTTAADVYVFWLGVASTLQELFAQPEEESGIPPELARKITGIVNKRYKSIIDEAPADVYFVAFFLDPDILAKPTSMSTAIFVPPAATGDDASSDDSHKAPIPRAYTRVKIFLKNLLQAEMKLMAQPLVKELEEADLADELRDQLLAYARGEYPFKQRLDRSQSSQPVLKWWLDLKEHRHARTLAMLAIKIYSIAVNSMAEERTVSNFTWFNSRLRSQQEVKTLVDMIQVRQWYLFKDYPQVSPKTHPTVRWRDMDKTIFTRRDARARTAAEYQEDDDDFFAEWPGEPAAGPNEKHSGRSENDHREAAAEAADSFELDELVDLQSMNLRGMLCETLAEDPDTDDESIAAAVPAQVAGTSSALPRKANWAW